MLIFLQELVLQVFIWLLRLADGIMEIFSSVVGVASVDYQGSQVNLIEFVIANKSVTNIFWCVFLLAIVLTCIFGIVALVKNMITTNKAISAIIGRMGLSVLGTMAMVAVVVLGILISGSFLQLVSRIFQIENTTKISNGLFNACVGEWLNGYSMHEIDVANCSVRDIFGDYEAAVFGIWPRSWKCNGMVNPNSFLYLPCMIAGIGLAIALIVALLNLAKRAYELVFLYLTLPFSMSTICVDDGARFKLWRETFITKIVLAYGSVFSVNIFILLLPILSSMRLEGVGNFGNATFLIFMILGGAMVIPAGQTLFARLFGNADDMRVSGSFLHSAYNGARFMSLMSLGVAHKLLRGTFHVGKGLLRGKGKKGEDDKPDEPNDGGDKYEEPPAETSEEGGESE